MSDKSTPALHTFSDGNAAPADPLKTERPGASHGGSLAPGVKRNAALTIAALGIVFGDIGTSPLYAVRAAALAAGHHLAIQLAIMGVISLIV